MNADGVLDTTQGLIGTNMYVYCLNNPINMFDPTGTRGELAHIVTTNLAGVKQRAEIQRATAKANTTNLPDYSKALNKVVEKNISIVKEKSVVTDTLWFKDQVTHGGPWDYKLPTQWEEGIRTTYLDIYGNFVWDGQALNAEQFGNMHYGIVGTAMGYSPFILYTGGGIAKIGYVKYFFTAFPPYWGDDKEDHYWIQRGINYYNNKYK